MGIFVTLEGGDGSGKATQSKLLVDRLQKVFGDHNVLHISFPQHGEPSSYYADQFLNGAYGTISDVHPDLASLPYALDRYAASHKIREHLAHPQSVVVSDRYVGSNLAHNGSKFQDNKERREYYERQMQTEYDILGIPVPDINIILLVSTEKAQSNVDKKAVRGYTSRTRDIHEEDATHLDRTKIAYHELVVLYPDRFTSIDCMDANGNMRSIKDIHNEIVTIFEKLTNQKI